MASSMRKRPHIDSRLPKPLMREHPIKEVRNIVIPLHREKGSQQAFFWEDWMYFFIQVLLESECYLDSAKLIAERLHEGLSNYLGNKNFYMSSYLFY